ncbi:Tim44 domain-containing protein [Dongshaea marina]|uniref:Tim44 domain-containing protein n=1 Tax=Dongshaea marina TaxID=2047966 RepID=UPI000D3E0C96|nr:Tim44-like domain-containing protein [Dongshaea marina]
MKKFLSVVAILFAFTLTTATAEAKKFGGSRSFGKSYKTAPAQPKNGATSQAQQKTQSNSKKGLMGGLLGGLLAGGLLAALMGGAFEGFKMMDFLIMAVIAFVLFRIFRSIMQAKAGAMKQQQPAYAANTQQRTSELNWGQQSSAAATSDPHVPFNLPQGFNLDAFLEGARDHYNTLQQAWNSNDFSKIQEYVTPELYNLLKEERATLKGEQHTEVMYLNCELVRADQTASASQLSVLFTGRYRDAKSGEEEDIKEVWHLERALNQSNAPWLIVGIEQ